MPTVHENHIIEVATALGLKLCVGCDGFFDTATTIFEVDEDNYGKEICSGCREFKELNEEIMEKENQLEFLVDGLKHLLNGVESFD
jgi:hypothetical protein